MCFINSVEAVTAECLARADSCSPALCGPGMFEAGSKGFIVQPPWMPHYLELRLVCTLVYRVSTLV